MATSPNITTLPRPDAWEHPIDEMNIQLMKMNGILATVMGTFNGKRDREGDFIIPSYQIYNALVACVDLRDEIEAGLDRLSDEFVVTEKPDTKMARVQS